MNYGTVLRDPYGVLWMVICRGPAGHALTCAMLGGNWRGEPLISWFRDEYIRECALVAIWTSWV